MLQFADKHLTRRLFRYTGSWAIFTIYTLEFAPKTVSSHVKEVLANFFQSVRISYRNVFMVSICNPPHCNCFNLYMLSIYYCLQLKFEPSHQAISGTVCDMPSVNILRYIQYSSIDYFICWRWLSGRIINTSRVISTLVKSKLEWPGMAPPG